LLMEQQAIEQVMERSLDEARESLWHRAMQQRRGDR
jgi:hypothetical protein